MSGKTSERRGLGRGLSALMADAYLTPETKDEPRRAEFRAPIEMIEPNPDQPRRSFDEQALAELANSIRDKGVIQPLIVRAHPSKANHYEIVAGERRWRAAQLAQIHDLPVIVRDLDDAEVLEVAIIENIQRADLNPLEEAQSYHQLMERFGHTQDKVAEALSKSRSHIANQLRLLTLPAEIQTFLREGKLSAGHARAMITASEPVRIARETIQKGLSVREVERMVKREKTGGGKGRSGDGKRGPATGDRDADTIELENNLSAAIGLRVTIAPKTAQSGDLVIHYPDLIALDRLCGLLGGGA